MMYAQYKTLERLILELEQKEEDGFREFEDTGSWEEIREFEDRKEESPHKEYYRHSRH